MMGFVRYSDIIYRAYTFSTKQKEIADKKYEIIRMVLAHHRLSPRTVLFVGFNPAILNCTAPNIYVTEISDQVQAWLAEQNVKATVISKDNLGLYPKSFDAVVAMEEYFTFADQDLAQKATFDTFCGTANQLMITTLRDYKNIDFKDREFSQPAVIKNDSETRLFLEYHEHDVQDRNEWTRSVYEITGDNLTASRNFVCRQMFFKQCAKFGYDAGATEFLVHKNLMWKSLIKKNYEHVISIKFG